MFFEYWIIFSSFRDIQNFSSADCELKLYLLKTEEKIIKTEKKRNMEWKRKKDSKKEKKKYKCCHFHVIYI
jgi:hypothetical protein